MVYSINLKYLSFKQNLSSLQSMLEDQKSTYVALKYGIEIPGRIYSMTAELLLKNIDQITYKKLKNLLMRYANVRKVGFTMDEEFIETVEVPVNYQGSGVGFITDKDDEVLLNVVL